MHTSTYLDLPSPEEGVVERHGGADRVLVRELDVGEPLRVTVELVAQDRHTVDGPASVEMPWMTSMITLGCSDPKLNGNQSSCLFKLLCRGAVINIPDVDGAAVNLHLLLHRETRDRRRTRRVAKLPIRSLTD